MKHPFFGNCARPIQQDLCRQPPSRANCNIVGREMRIRNAACHDEAVRKFVCRFAQRFG
jgi:hypothetical protein